MRKYVGFVFIYEAFCYNVLLWWCLYSVYNKISMRQQDVVKLMIHKINEF